MISKIADAVLYGCMVADVVVAILYAVDSRWYKATYWLAAAAINFTVIKMR